MGLVQNYSTGINLGLGESPFITFSAVTAAFPGATMMGDTAPAQLTLFDCGMKRVDSVQASAAYVQHKLAREVITSKKTREKTEAARRETAFINTLYQKRKTSRGRMKGASMDVTVIDLLKGDLDDLEDAKDCRVPETGKRRRWGAPERTVVFDAIKSHGGNVCSAVNYLKLHFPETFKGLNESTVRTWFKQVMPGSPGAPVIDLVDSSPDSAPTTGGTDGSGRSASDSVVVIEPKLPQQPDRGEYLLYLLV